MPSKSEENMSIEDKKEYLISMINSLNEEQLDYLIKYFEDIINQESS